MKAFFKEKKRSAGYARDRMKLLLISERIDCSPQMMKMLRNDMIHTVKKYLTIDEKQIKIKILQFQADSFFNCNQPDWSYISRNCCSGSEVKTVCRCSAGNYNYVSPFPDGLFLDYELSVDYVWLQYYNAAGCAYCW